MPLYEPREPKLNEYTQADLDALQHHFGPGLLGLTQEHETWIDPIWKLAAAAVDNEEEASDREIPAEHARAVVFHRVLHALDAITYGVTSEPGRILTPDTLKLP